MALMKVLLCLWLTVSGVGASYVPQEMNKTIQNLLQYYVSMDRNVLERQAGALICASVHEHVELPHVSVSLNAPAALEFTGFSQVSFLL